MNQSVVTIKKHYSLAVIPHLKGLQKSSSSFRSLERHELESRRRVTASLAASWNFDVIAMARTLDIGDVSLHWFKSDGVRYVLYGFTTN